MPPKIIFTKEEIIQSAFDIFKNEGIENITARNVAAKLGCSTAPIYKNFQNINEIKQEVMEKAFGIMQGYTEKEYTKNLFLNMGVGLLCFARDYKKIYKTIFMDNSNYKSLIMEFGRRNLILMQKEKTLKPLDEKSLRQIFNKMYIFTQGFAALLCAEMIEDTTDEHFIDTLHEVGLDIITSTMLKKGI